MVLIRVAPVGATCSDPAFQPGDPGRGAVDVRRVDTFVIVGAAREDLLASPIQVPSALFFGRNDGLCCAVQSAALGHLLLSFSFAGQFGRLPFAAHRVEARVLRRKVRDLELWRSESVVRFADSFARLLLACRSVAA